jgi:hypothetical protein
VSILKNPVVSLSPKVPHYIDIFKDEAEGVLPPVYQNVELCVLCHIKSGKVLPRGNKAPDPLGKGASQA